MAAILGISALYHDSAAALVVDGRIVAAAQQERFSRKKHDAGWPVDAIDYCLREAGLDAASLDYVAFYEKPLLKFERLLETYLAFAPRGFRSFATAMPAWLKQKLHTPRELARLLGGYRKRVVFTEHHESHAASAFYPSPFEEAAILTLDGVGEWTTASFGTGLGNQIRLTQELRFPHSLGMLYSAFTSFCGFRVNSGEYKLMGLAPYGQPAYAPLILERLMDLKADGSFRLDLSYFNYCHGLTMTSRKFERLFGGPPRVPEGEITMREKDLAASIQTVTEEILLRMARHVHRETRSNALSTAGQGPSRLCLAGGVALNSVANGRLAREGPFDQVWVQPAAGDAGGALGAALFVWHALLNQPRQPHGADSMQLALLGPSFSSEQVRQFLDRAGACYRTLDDADLCAHVAALLAEGKLVGWLQGPMEFGPRALGARSILADARNPQMLATLNERIKRRESFRPLAPAVLQERAGDWFDVPPGWSSPYMMFVTQARQRLPATTHVDNSARVQTVDVRHGRFHRLLQAFESLTGTPALVNTSFNVRGEPIVCTPEEAYDCFLATGLDVLVLEDCLLVKEEQPASAQAAARERRTAVAIPD